MSRLNLRSISPEGMFWTGSLQWKREQNFRCLSGGTCVVITKHPQIHSPVSRSSLVRYGAVVATSITELNTVYTQGALWQQRVPETKTEWKDESGDKWSEWHVETLTRGIFGSYLWSWVMGKPSFLHVTVAWVSSSTSHGNSASWPVCVVTSELLSLIIGGTAEMEGPL